MDVLAVSEDQAGKEDELGVGEVVVVVPVQGLAHQSQGLLQRADLTSFQIHIRLNVDPDRSRNTFFVRIQAWYCCKIEKNS